MIPNLKKCFKDAYCFLLPSFSGVSQPGTVPFQPVRGCQQHAWEAQSLQLRSHFVTSPVSLAVESSEALQHSVHLTHVLEKQFGFPVKFPKASCYRSSPVCKTIRFMGQGGLALPRTEVAALQRRSLQRSGWFIECLSARWISERQGPSTAWPGAAMPKAKPLQRANESCSEDLPVLFVR